MEVIWRCRNYYILTETEHFYIVIIQNYLLELKLKENSLNYYQASKYILYGLK